VKKNPRFQYCVCVWGGGEAGETDVNVASY